MATEDQANEAKKRHSGHLLAIPGICGLGVEKQGSDYYLAVHIDPSVSGVAEAVPKMLDGVTVVHHLSGPFSI